MGYYYYKKRSLRTGNQIDS